MLGAGAAPIVRVRIAALVVGIDIAQPRVAGVVVVAAATGEALTNARIQKPSKSRHVPGVTLAGLPSLVAALAV